MHDGQGLGRPVRLEPRPQGLELRLQRHGRLPFRRVLSATYIETRRPEPKIHSVAYAAPLAGRVVALEPHPLLDGVREPVGPLVEVGLAEVGDGMRRIEEGIARLPPALCHGSASVTKRSGDDGDA